MRFTILAASGLDISVFSLKADINSCLFKIPPKLIGASGYQAFKNFDRGYFIFNL
jgi:hypothetical protein